ncbi:MAG: hypothetical protein ACK41F_05035 [Fimbriimonadaceae bacterium]
MRDVFESARVPVRPVAERYTSIDRRGNGPCPFCGGSDRFYVRKDGLHWGCRKCGRKGDAVDLVAEMERVSKAEAARMLSGAPVAARERPGPAPKPSVPQQSEGDRMRLSTLAADAERRMPGSPAERYCLARGLSRETVGAFRLGSSQGRDGSPMVAIPWTDGSGAVEALKLRAASDRPKGVRYVCEKGSRPTLFGLHLAPERAGVLLATEGEFNCMAVWQALRGTEGVCCVSVGSESGPGTRLLPALARRLGARSAAVWMDDPERARAVADSLRSAGLACSAIRSPEGMDAADVLRAHGAAGLARMLRRLVPSLPPQGERFEDGYDPFAEPGSEERAPERLWARLLALGCRVGLDAKGRLRVGGAGGVPEWMRESVREDREGLEALLRRLGPLAENGPFGYVGSALWARSLRCAALLRLAEREGAPEAGLLAGMLEEADRARTEGRTPDVDAREARRLSDSWERSRGRRAPSRREILRALGVER